MAGILQRLVFLLVLPLLLSPLPSLPLFLEHVGRENCILGKAHVVASSSATGAAAASDGLNGERVRLRGEDVVALVKEVILGQRNNRQSGNMGWRL